MKNLLLCLLVFVSTSAFAAEWISHSIPGALCGDGSPYKIFIKQGDPKKLAVEFMGGGACWNMSTCWGPNLHTWIHPIPKLPAFSYLTTEESPINDHTLVYLPYCTGDVFAGDHTASYAFNSVVHHHGSRNVLETLDYLNSTKLVRFDLVKKFIAFGSSGGAIGSVLHSDNLERYLNPKTKKLLIADSVGFHFGQDFWKKFPDALLADFKRTFDSMGLTVNMNDGLVAPSLKTFCELQSDWKVGFIQTTRDIIMSKMFGDITQDEHRKLVLGPHGIRQTLKDSPNCSTHIIEGEGHMILIIPKVLETTHDMFSGVSTKDYVDQLVKGF